MVEKRPDESRARYVWDRDKLAWVEAEEKPRPEKAFREESLAEATYEEGLEEVSAEDVLVEALGAAEGLQYRGAWIRLAGVFLDGLFILVINAIAGQILGTESAVASWLVPIIGAAYFIGFWTWRGQTPGKMIIGAKIIKKDGSPISLGRAILRYACYFVYLLIPRFAGGQYWVFFVVIFVAFLVIAFSREKRGLHDLIAGTVVINTRPKPLEDYEDEEEGYEEEYEGAYEAEEEGEDYVSEDN